MSSATPALPLHVTREGSGPPILFIHGGGPGGPGGAEQWAAQRPLARQGWELVLPDRPGHGSSPSRGPEDLTEDAAWVADLLGGGAHLVGHSYGGAIALCAAGLRPEAVWSLTLIEAPIFSVDGADEGVQELQSELAGAIGREDPVEAIIAFAQAVRLPRDPNQPPPSLEQLRKLGEGLREMRPPYSWDAAASIAALAQAQVPALLVSGGWSPGFEAIADALAHALDGERRVIAAGHHLPQIAPDAKGVPGADFNRVLQAFLRVHGPSPQPGPGA